MKLEGLLRRDGAAWHVVVPLIGVTSAEEARKPIDAAGVVNARWVDLQATSREMMGAFRANALRAFGLGAVLIVGVLAIGLRGIAAACASRFPSRRPSSRRPRRSSRSAGR